MVRRSSLRVSAQPMLHIIEPIQRAVDELAHFEVDVAVVGFFVGLVEGAFEVVHAVG